MSQKDKTSKSKTSKNGKDSGDRYVHLVKSTKISGEKRVIHDEGIFDSASGTTIKYYHNENGNAEKILITKLSDNKFKVVTLVKGEKDEKELDQPAVLKMVQSDARLKFALDFVKTGKRPQNRSSSMSRANKSSKSSKSSKTSKSSKSRTVAHNKGSKSKKPARKASKSKH